MYVKRRSHNSSLALLATLVLGVAIGLSVGYAFWGTQGEVPEEVPVPTTAAAPESEGQEPVPIETAEAVAPDGPPAVPPTTEPITETVSEPETPPETEPVSEQEAPPDLLGRYEEGAETWPGLFLFIGITGPTLDEDTKELLAEIKPGGVVLLGTHLNDPATVLALTLEIKQAEGLGLGIDSLPVIAVEQEGGDFNSLGLELAPSAAELGRGANTKTARAVGRSYAAAAVSRGIGVILAPVLDVGEADGGAVVAASRSFGNDQEQVKIMGLSFAEGVSDGGAIPVAKYYPGIATARKDSENMLVLDKDVPRLAELMYPFNKAAEEGIPGIMVGNVAVPALDEYDPVRPASASPVLVQKILREYWNYEGVILAADVALDPMTRARSSERAVVEALAAGCDAVLFLDLDVTRIRAACVVIGESIANGTLRRAQLSESRKRIQTWQDWLAVSNPESAAETLTQVGVETPAPPVPVETETPAAPPVPVETEPPAAAPPVPVETETPAAPPAPVETETPAAPPAPVETEMPDTEPELTPEPEVGPEKIEDPVSAVGAPARETQFHTVVLGDQLKMIAGRYGTTVEELVKLNKLIDPNKVLLGQRLIVPKTGSALEAPEEAVSEAEMEPATDAVPELPPTPEPEVQAQPPAETDQAAPSEPEAQAQPVPVPKDVPEQDPPEEPLPVMPPEPEDLAEQPVDLEPRTELVGIHVVVPGDQLYLIAGRYGTTAKKLTELNGLTNPDKVLVGQRLKIPMAAQPDEPSSEPESTPVPETPAPDTEPEPEAAKGSEPLSEPEPGLDNAAISVVEVPVVEVETVEEVEDLPEPQEPSETEAKSVIDIEEDEASPETAVASEEVTYVVPAPPNTVLHVHRVEPGETLADIAERYGIGEKELMGWNALLDNQIRPGQAMLVHRPREEAKVKVQLGTYTQAHTVRAGEGLKGIADQYGITLQDLIELNNLDDPDLILVGQRLLVPKTP